MTPPVLGVDAILASAADALAQCATRADCMRVRDALYDAVLQLETYANEACFERAYQLDQRLCRAESGLFD